MKKIKTLFTLPLIGVLLTGCVGTKHYAEGDYIIPVPWKQAEDFRILQLGDIHLSQSDLHEEHFAVIDRTIKAAKPNLIELNGDIFTYADKHTVKKFFEFIDSHGILWTYAFGNHDDQGYYSDVYIQRLLGSGSYTHCLFKNLEDDDVTGRSNFVLDLRNEAHETLYQVFILDSHNYNFDVMGYDNIKQDQIDWYERMVNYAKGKNGGVVVPSSIYMHIALPVFTDNWEQLKPEDFKIGDMEEGGGSAVQDLGFYNKIKELNSTHSIHVNHDHANDSVLLYEGINFVYGVHSTNRIYTDNNSRKLGGSLMKINKTTKELHFENYYSSYTSNEVTLVTEKEAA